MERIMVIGCCGAGKSTFSRKLSAITNLDIIHLDQHYWKPNWTETDSLEWTKTVRELSHRPRWIMDGNYGGTMELRISRADTIVFLDYSTITCLWRITKRIFKYKGRERPDMPDGCKERFDWDFYRFVATFNKSSRKRQLDLLQGFNDEKHIHIFKNDKEADRFLKSLL